MIKNIAHSIRMKLRNISSSRNRPYQETLEYYAIERFLSRLSRSKHSNKFVLKGAIMFYLWSKENYRPTRDIDFSGYIENKLELLLPIIKAVCERDEKDGIILDTSTLNGSYIMTNGQYKGIRISITCYLEKVKIVLKIDIGMGDTIVPHAEIVNYPVLIKEFPEIKIKAYPKEVVISEKYETIVSKRLINSRIKDFFDIYALIQKFEFNGPILKKSVQSTFKRRNTEIELNPIALGSEFYSNDSKKLQWNAFINKNKTTTTFPPDLKALIDSMNKFLQPIANSCIEDIEFNRVWTPPGPWTEI